MTSSEPFSVEMLEMIHLSAAYLKEKMKKNATSNFKKILEIDPDLKSNVLQTYPELLERLNRLKAK